MGDEGRAGKGGQTLEKQSFAEHSIDDQRHHFFLPEEGSAAPFFWVFIFPIFHLHPGQSISGMLRLSPERNLVARRRASDVSYAYGPVPFWFNDSHDWPAESLGGWRDVLCVPCLCVCS